MGNSITALRAKRKAQGVSLMDLARRARLDYTTVQPIDAGKVAGGLTTRFKISAALGDKSFRLWPEDARAELREFRRSMSFDETK